MKAAFSSVFGKKKPLKEILRENKRTITRAVRDIDREKNNLEKQEKKLVGEIKKNAKAGQMGAVKARNPQSVCLMCACRASCCCCCCFCFCGRSCLRVFSFRRLRYPYHDHC